MPIIPVQEFEPISLKKIEDACKYESIEFDLNLIYTDVLEKGLIRIETRKNVQNDHVNLCIVPNGLVGLVPIANSVFLWVKPKISIANIDHMVKTYGGIISKDVEEIREYAMSSISSNALKDSLANGLVSKVETIVTIGLWKEFLRFSSINGEYVGVLDVSNTIRQYTSHNISYKASSYYYNRTANIAPNKLLKTALLVLLHASYTTSETKQRIRRVLMHFQEIQEDTSISLLREVERYEACIPSSRPMYQQAIPLAKAILLERDLDLASISGPLTFETLFIDMAELFEKYVRELFKNYLTTYSVIDGNNSSGTLALFNDYYSALDEELRSCTYNAYNANGNRSLKPDILLYQSSSLIGAFDVKYKIIGPTAEVKREDIEQAVTYACRLGLDRIATIHPSMDGNESGLYYLGNIGSVEVYCYQMNLNSENPSYEESKMISAIISLLKR